MNINEEKLKESNKTINELKNQLNNDKLKEDETIKNLKINQEKEIENLKNQLLAEKNNAEIFNKKFEELKADYEKKIISLNEQLNQKDLEIKKTQENAKSSSKSSQDLQNKHKEEIERIKFSNTLTLNELKLKHDKELADLRLENMNLKENIDKAKEKDNIIHKLKLQLKYARIGIIRKRRKI